MTQTYEKEPIRWIAYVYYQTENGLVDVVHYLTELDEIDEKVEKGPHWDTIYKIEIYRYKKTEKEDLTVPESEKL